jgi:hypothetical protein
MTIEFGNVIFKIAVTRDDGVKDYTDVCDLIFYDEETEEILRYIDAEDLIKDCCQKSALPISRNNF